MADRTITGTLICSKCGERKSTEAFHRCSQWARGYAYKCKACVKAYQQADRRANPSKYSARDASRRPALKAAEREQRIRQYLASGLKVCGKCGIEKPFSEFYQSRAAKSRDKLFSCCKTCKAAYDASRRPARRIYEAAYRARRVEAIRESQRRSRLKRRTVRNIEMREWKLRNKERISEYEKGYHERRLSLRRARYAANADRARKRSSQWKKANRDKAELSRKLRRARKRGAAGSYTLAEAEALLVSQNHRCANPYCRTDLRIAKKCLDHIVALANSGSNFISNMQWLCIPCNSRKTTFSQEVWLEREAKRNV